MIFFQRIVLLVLFAACLPLPVMADDAPVSDETGTGSFRSADCPSGTACRGASELIRKIEYRSNAWVAYRADLTLEFTNAKNESGRCRGDLTYDRLNEKMLLRCSNDRQEPLFIFKTSDTHFELYLASDRTVYRGHMDQTEDPANIESHLEPLALYRSLKLMAIPGEDAEISAETKDTATLSLWTRKDNLLYVSRMITADRDGNVLSEGYYNPQRIARTMIDRSDFRKIKDSARLLSEPVYFPYHINLITHDPSGENEKTTRITFEKISLLPSVDKTSWDISYPAGTRQVDLN